MKILPSLRQIENLIFFLSIIFLPTQLGKHFWPEFSFIYSLRIDYLSPTVYFWDLLIASLSFIWLIQKPKINNLSLGLLLFFILTQLISLFNSFNLGAGLVRLEQYLVAGFFGIYLASHSFESIKRSLILGMQVALLFESLLTLLEFILGRSLEIWVIGERSFSLSTPSIAKFNLFNTANSFVKL